MMVSILSGTVSTSTLTTVSQSLVSVLVAVNEVSPGVVIVNACPPVMPLFQDMVPLLVELADNVKDSPKQIVSFGVTVRFNGSHVASNVTEP